MQTLEEFRNTYKEKYQPELNALESQRLTILLLMAVCVISAFLSWFFWYSEVFFLTFLFLVIGLSSGIYAYISYKEYRISFKLKIVRAIIAGIDPNYKYFYDSHIAPKHFINSSLYKKEPDRIHGDDLIQGKHDDILFEMSELYASRKEGDETIDIFKGIFMQFSLPISFKDETYILENNTDLTTGFQSQKKELRYHGKRIPFDDTLFDQKFSVFGFDENESRQILNPKVQKSIRRFTEANNKTSCFSFKNSKAYCTITFYEKLFEPKLFETGEYPGYIKDIYNQISMAEELCRCMADVVKHWEDEVDLPAPEVGVTVVENADSTNDNQSLIQDEAVEISEPEASTDKGPEPVQVIVEVPVIPPPTINLKELFYDFIVSQPFPEALSLKDYLSAMIGQIETSREEELDQKLVGQIMTDAINATPMEVAPEWHDIRSAPDPKVKYQRVTDKAELEAMTADQFEWNPIDFSLEVLRFQAAELDKMSDDQLNNPMKEYGISSPTGTSWYNFTPAENVKAGLQAMIAKHDAELLADWSFFGHLMQAGRAKQS